MDRVIGFSNLTEESAFCVTVRESLEAAVGRHPGLKLLCRDNALNDERAMRNAQEFAEIPVNLAIIFHINERLGAKISPLLLNRGIPIIAIDIPIPFATYFGVPNQEAGIMAGVKLAEWIEENWNGQVDKVLALVEPRVLDVVRRRIAGTVQVLQERIGYNPADVFYLDCGNERNLSIERMIPVLQQWDGCHRIAIIGFNEESTLGALDAISLAKREADVAVVGQGADKDALVALQVPGTRLVATTSYRPDTYGARIVDLALRMLNRERVPQENYIDLELYTPESFR